MSGIQIAVLLARDGQVSGTESPGPEIPDSCELEDGQTVNKDFIESIEREFVENADGILEMLNLSHLKVSSKNES